MNTLCDECHTLAVIWNCTVNYDVADIKGKYNKYTWYVAEIKGKYTLVEITLSHNSQDSWNKLLLLLLHLFADI